MKTMIRILILSFFSLLLFNSCKEDQPNSPSNIDINYSTNLVDSDNNPIINAIVSINEIDNNNVIAVDTSDENGLITFENLSVSTENLLISISHPLYNTKEFKYGDINDKENGTVTLEDKDDCCGSAELTIKDEDGNTIKDVEVKVRQKMKVLKKGKSDENGTVKFTGLCLEEYEFRLAKDGFKVIEELVNIENCDETLSLNFKMIKTESKEDTCCDGVLIFKPKDKDGNILNGTKIYLYKDGKLIEDPVVENGKAVLDGLCEGKYTIVYKKDGYSNKEAQVEVGCDEEKTLEQTLEKNDDDCCEAILKFIVKDNESKKAIEGAKVTLKLNGKVVLEKKATDKEGEFLAKELCKGKYTVIIEKDGYKTIETTWNIEKCDDFQETFWMNKNDDCCDGVLIFKPKDKDGNILNGTKIYLYKDGKLIEDPVVENGKALLDGLCEGKYTIVYKKDGYSNKEVQVEVGCDEEKTLEHTLEKNNDDCCEAVLKFIVKDKNGKNALKDAKITLKLNGKVIFEKKSTNADGIVIEDGLCKGKYTVIIERDGYETIETTWNIEKCDDFQETFWMNKNDDCCDGVLIFKPKDKDGNILNGTKIYLYKDGKLIEDPVVENGKAVLDGLCEGKYTIVYKKDGYSNKEVQVEVGCHEEKTLEQTLEKNDNDCCEGIVKVKVKDDKGNIIKNASVRLWKGKNKLKELKTNSDGYVEFKELCEGNDYSLSISAEGFEGYEFEFDLGCNKVLNYDKSLKSKDDCCEAILKFIVKDNESKKAIEGAKVTLKLNGKVVLEKKTTDNEGELLAKELCKGKYTVIIEKDGYKTIEITWNIEKCDDFQETFWMKK